MVNIKLSPQHGVNPAIPKCFFCQEDKNEILMPGRMKDDMEAPRNSVWDMNPCSKCEDFMSQGIILISVGNGQMEQVNRDLELTRAEFDRKHGYRDENWKRTHFNWMPNPSRTGGWVVVKDSVIQEMIQPQELADRILSDRWIFVPDETWDAIGLPRDGEEE